MAPRISKEFIRLFAIHQRPIYRYIFTLLPDQDRAEDVFQETVMALWEKFGEYRVGEPFLPWAYQFAYFKVLEQRKKDRRDPVLLDDDVLQILAEEQLHENDQLEAQLKALSTCMAKLTENEQRLLLVRYDGRATVTQIAEQTGRLAETLYRVLHRARKKLLLCIERTLALDVNV